MILLSLMLLLIPVAKGNTICQDSYSCPLDHISITAQCSNDTALVQYTGGIPSNRIAIESHCYYYNNNTLAGTFIVTHGWTNRREWSTTINNFSIDDTYCIFKGCVKHGRPERTCHIQSKATCSCTACTSSATSPTQTTITSTYSPSSTFSVSSSISTSSLMSSSISTISITSYSIPPTVTSTYSSSSRFFVSSISTSSLMLWSISHSYTRSTNTINTNILSTIDGSSETSSFPISSTSDASPFSTTSTSFFSLFSIILLAVIGFIALLVLCLGLAICIVYWQYSKYQTMEGKKIFEDIPMFDMEIYKLDKISLSGSVITVLQPLQDITIERTINPSGVQTDDSRSYNVKRSSSVPTISQRSNSTLNLTDDESTRTGRGREENTNTGLAVNRFDDLQDSNKESETLKSTSPSLPLSPLKNTTNGITTSTPTNHHPLSKFPPQLSVINDDTLEYIKMTDLQQHQTEDDEEDGYSSMSLYNTALDETDTHT